MYKLHFSSDDITTFRSIKFYLISYRLRRIESLPSTYNIPESRSSSTIILPLTMIILSCFLFSIHFWKDVLIHPKNASRFGIPNWFLQWQSGSADWLQDLPQAREGRLTTIIITIIHTILITIARNHNIIHHYDNGDDDDDRFHHHQHTKLIGQMSVAPCEHYN